MRAVGYFRDWPRDGLAEQNSRFLEFCSGRGYEVASTFSDDATSQPAGFRSLIEFLRRPEKGFVVVVTASPQHLAADLSEAARRYFLLESLGTQVQFTDIAGDASDALLQAWSERAGGGRLGERVRAAMRKKAVKGEVLGRPPYGYKVGNRRRLELVADEAVVVRYIYRLYLHEGLGIRLIARRLNEEGFKTRKGGNWSMVSIRDILRNRAYLGTYSRFGVRVPGSHPALVSPDDFNQVQERLTARRTSFTPRTVAPFLLSGLAYCGYCRNRLIGVSRRQTWKRRDGGRGEGTYRYYQCESRTNQSLCDYHTRRAERLETEVAERLAGTLDSVVGAEGPADDSRAAEWEAEAGRLQQRARALDRRLEGYLDGAARGRITRERLRALSVEASAERLALEQALDEAQARARHQADAEERRRTREQALARLLGGWESLSFEDRRSLLRDIVAAIVVTDDAIDIQLRP